MMQAGLRLELEIATNDMDRAQRQQAAVEKQQAVLDSSYPINPQQSSTDNHNSKVILQAGLRSELEIATDEMERAQRQLAALEKQREVLQQGSTAASPRVAVSTTTASSALEDSLRRELQSQVHRCS